MLPQDDEIGKSLRTSFPFREHYRYLDATSGFAAIFFRKGAGWEYKLEAGLYHNEIRFAAFLEVVSFSQEHLFELSAKKTVWLPLLGNDPNLTVEFGI